MDYELIENITSADIAIRVKAPTLTLLFKYGAEALMSEMVEDISSIKQCVTKEGLIEGADLSLLYFEFLNEILFYKDSSGLFLLPSEIKVYEKNRDLHCCFYKLNGETINSVKHKIKTDIKAVTLHRLKIYNENNFFIAESVFDV